MKNVTSRDVLLQTEEFEKAGVFYRDTLGMTEFMREAHMIGLEGDGIRLFLEDAPCLGPVFEFFVDSLSQAKTALLAEGCRIEVEDLAVPKCYIRDPFGLLFNIAERKLS